VIETSKENKDVTVTQTRHELKDRIVSLKASYLKMAKY